MLDPVAWTIANAPFDDEPVTDQERRAIAESDEWLKHNKPIHFEKVLADFGLTLEELKSHQEPDGGVAHEGRRLHRPSPR
jgi:hypothetical protein